MTKPHSFIDPLAVGSAILLVFVILAVSAHGQSDRQREAVVEPFMVGIGPVERASSIPWVVRSRLVEIDADVLRSTAQRVADKPSLPVSLFDDLTVSIDVQDVEVFGPDRFTLTGTVARVMGSVAVLTVRDSTVSGFISLPRIGEFRIAAADAGRYRIVQVDPALLPQCGVGPHEPVRPVENPDVPLQTNAETIVIKLFVVYTPDAAQDLGGWQQLVADVQTSVAVANLVLANSLTNVQFKLLLVSEVDYIECDDLDEPIYPDCMELDLGLLAAGVDVFETVHEWRSTLCADLVIMIVTYDPATEEPAGIAQPMLDVTGTSADRGFSVVRTDALLGFTTAHELGHNLGGAHDHAQGPGGIYSYSFGHRFWGQSSLLSDPLWITVMSYPPGTRIPYFSNPNVLFDGLPTGVPANMPFEADMALTIINNAPLVAQYGDQVCLTGVSHGVGPGDSIQAAIDAAENGDEIVVANGTYNEVIDLKGKLVYLRKSDDPGTVILDGSANPGASVITCNSGEGTGTVIQGFTIRNGTALRGGGMFIKESSPVIVDCIFEDNEALLTGGGVFIDDGYPLFHQCSFVDNVSMHEGGGLYAQYGAPRLSACSIEGNSAGVGSEGRGGGIFLKESDLTMIASSVGYSNPNAPDDDQRNVAGAIAGGGGIYVLNEEEDEEDWILPRIGSSIICGNLPNNIADPWNDLENNDICSLDVDILVPADYPTIQAAIDASNHGEVIVVSPGTYPENIDLKGKQVYLRSFDPGDPAIVAATIIDGQGNGSTVKCVTGETIDTIIDGFTITGGHALHGGGIRIQNSNPIIDRCVVVGNHATTAGGGVYVSLSAGTLRNTSIMNNTSAHSGGGLNIESSNSFTVDSCTIEGNHTDFLGGGVTSNTSNHLMTDLVIFNNTAGQWGGGMYNGNGGRPVLLNASITGNTAVLGGGLYNAVNSLTGLADSSLCDNTPWEIFGPWLNLGGNSVLEICPPLNNSPENATPINKSLDTIVGSFYGATKNGTASCDPDGVDVFFTYTIVGGPATLSLNTCGSADDTALAVFDPLGNEVACNATCAGGSCGAPHACLTIPALTDGVYLIRVSRTASAAAGIGADDFLLQFTENQMIIDLNTDGAVDVSDLLILLGAWGPCPNCPADFTGDGQVDVSDLLIMLSNWG